MYLMPGIYNLVYGDMMVENGCTIKSHEIRRGIVQETKKRRKINNLPRHFAFSSIPRSSNSRASKVRPDRSTQSHTNERLILLPRWSSNPCSISSSRISLNRSSSPTSCASLLLGLFIRCSSYYLSYCPLSQRVCSGRITLIRKERYVGSA